MHGYALHRPVQAPCVCCQIGTEFLFKSPSDHVICRGCERHQGDSLPKLKQRDSDHIGLWTSTLAVYEADAASREDVLSQRISVLEEQIGQQGIQVADLRETVKRGFDAAPLPAVEKWLHDEEMTEALRRRDVAYRWRDRAFQVLWAVDNLHRPKPDDERHCVCGVSTSRCAVSEAMQPVVESLIRWEAEEIDRLRRGLESGLPADHPEWKKHSAAMRRRRYVG